MPYFSVIAGPLSGRNFILNDSITMLGTAPDCDLRLMGAGIAGRHALVTNQDNRRFILRDLGDHVATTVNGQHASLMPLGEGARVDVGPHVLEFHAGAPLMPLQDDGTEKLTAGATAILDVISDYNEHAKEQKTERRRSYALRFVKIAIALGALAAIGWGIQALL